MAWKPDYATAAELKSWLHVADTDDDTLMAIWVTTASRAVDSWARRQFGRVASAESRTYDTVWDRVDETYVAVIDDVDDVTELAVTDSNGDAVTSYTLQPVNALKKGKPYERMVTATKGPLTISALWGWTAVPSAVKNATLLQAARLANRRSSPYGVAGSPTEGSEMRLLATLDPDVKTSLIDFRRKWWAG